MLLRSTTTTVVVPFTHAMYNSVSPCGTLVGFYDKTSTLYLRPLSQVHEIIPDIPSFVDSRWSECGRFVYLYREGVLHFRDTTLSENFQIDISDLANRIESSVQFSTDGWLMLINVSGPTVKSVIVYIDPLQRRRLHATVLRPTNHENYWAWTWEHGTHRLLFSSNMRVGHVDVEVATATTTATEEPPPLLLRVTSQMLAGSDEQGKWSPNQRYVIIESAQRLLKVRRTTTTVRRGPPVVLSTHSKIVCTTNDGKYVCSLHCDDGAEQQLSVWTEPFDDRCASFPTSAATIAGTTLRIVTLIGGGDDNKLFQIRRIDLSVLDWLSLCRRGCRISQKG